MHKYVRLPFLFFFIAGCIGLLLRWNFISPLPWIKYSNWLHAHSHIMFLGWVFNLICLAFIHEHIPKEKRKRYTIMYIFIQCLLAGMLISFPLQGYGAVSIIFSSLHTVAVGVISFWFFKDTNDGVFDASRWLARIALMFFLLSALGPFSLGPMVVNGMGQTNWYYFAVYYYLHFQYNGVFTFSVLSLFFGWLRERNIEVDEPTVKRFVYLMMVSCVLGYSLSILWAKPGIFFIGLGLIAAALQFVAFYYFITIVRAAPVALKQPVPFSVRILFGVSFLSFAVKLVLQAVSVHPYIAQLAYEVRNYVIAYLHLVLIGMITCFLLGWSIEKKWIKEPPTPILTLFLAGFVGMELVMINPLPLNDRLINFVNLLFLFSCLLVIASGFFVYNAFKRETH